MFFHVVADLFSRICGQAVLLFTTGESGVITLMKARSNSFNIRVA